MQLRADRHNVWLRLYIDKTVVSVSKTVVTKQKFSAIKRKKIFSQYSFVPNLIVVVICRRNLFI